MKNKQNEEFMTHIILTESAIYLSFFETRFYILVFCFNAVRNEVLCEISNEQTCLEETKSILSIMICSIL